MEQPSKTSKIDVTIEAGAKASQFQKVNGPNYYLVSSIKAPPTPEDSNNRNPIDLIAAVDFSTSLFFFSRKYIFLFVTIIFCRYEC